MTRPRQTNQTPGTTPGQRPVFATRDFYLACFLRCIGYDLLDLRAEGRRRVFVFGDQPARQQDVVSFYADRASVRPLAFSSTIKEMKALLYNA